MQARHEPYNPPDADWRLAVPIVPIPVILSGGSGTRLWPVSREARARAFAKLGGPPNRLQRAPGTADRAVRHPVDGAGAMRFFYALRPETGAATELGRLAAGLAARLGGRPLSAQDLHLTLVFVGTRPAGDANLLLELLRGFAPRWPQAPGSAELPLTRLGTFGRGLWWAGPAGPLPDWPATLADTLRQRLRDAAIGFDRRALHLHLTLLRGARRGESIDGLDDALPIVPAHWTLALGWSGADSTPQHRYRWREASG